MIRLIQRRLIIPRGDTGSFSLPVLANKNTGDIAVFTIFDSLTKTKAFQKIIEIEGDVLTIAFSHNETVNLKPGKYFWDIKFYNNPQFVEDELVNGDEVDSYYAGFTMPACEIRETADNYLVSPDSPTATLSPEQLDIITGAISELNEAIRKTNENVEHYPEIRDEVWYVWDAEQGDYVSTDVRANGIVGNGIASAVLNDDYTLTLNFTDGTSFTSSSIRGQRGNGIEDIVLNNDFTLTITYTDGDSYVTPSIRGPVGATPQFSIGTVQEGAVAAASITGTAENPVLNLTLPNANVPTKVSQLENDANYAVDANYVHTDNNYTTAEKNKLSGIAAGAEVNINADWNAISGDAQILNKPTKVSDFANDAGYLTTETDPTVPAWAKAAQKPSYTAAEVGAPTVAEMNTAIGEAVGQINSFDMAIVQALPTQNISTHTIYLVPKTGETNDVYDEYIYINSKWEMVGNTQIDLSDYALKSELPTKVSELSNDSGYLTSYTETDPTVPQWAKANTKPSYTAAEVGALPSDTHIPSTTAELTNDAGFITANDVADAPVQDVQVNGVSVLSDGVANVPVASTSDLGVVKVNSNSGINLSNNTLALTQATDAQTKAGTNSSYAVRISKQHISTFYGLAKAAGADMASISDTTVGTYPDAQKEAIQSMLGISQMLAPENPNLVATQAYAIGDVFAANGHLYKATAAIAQDGAIIPDTNCVETTMVDESVRDVQVNGTSILNNGVANIPVADVGVYGIVKIASSVSGSGISVDGYGNIVVSAATSGLLKKGTNFKMPIVASTQHESAFYGLSKVAGVDLANEIVTLGTYPETSKTAIRSMIGAASSNVIAVQDTQPTDTDTKIWLPETAETPVEVPTVAEMEQALSGKVDDVQVDGTSIVNNGVVNIPVADNNTLGLIQIDSSYGITRAQNVVDNNLVTTNFLSIATATNNMIKLGQSNMKPITPINQHRSAFYGLAKAAGDTTQSQSNNAVGTYTDEAKAAIRTMLGAVGTTDYASSTDAGIIKVGSNGITLNSSGVLTPQIAIESDIKIGTTTTKLQVPANQHISTFYGLAKASGDTTQSASSNAVGQYTDNAKASIKSMLGIVDGSTGTVDVSGTTPTIVAVENTRYVCGEVTSLDFTPAASGICIVRFTSGSTVTVLTLPSTVKFPEWFDPASLETNTIYEICITDGVYGAVMSWAQ